MEDLDKYLESELASINDMFEQFETQDQQFEQRIRSETQELQAMETKSLEVATIPPSSPLSLSPLSPTPL